MVSGSVDHDSPVLRPKRTFASPQNNYSSALGALPAASATSRFEKDDARDVNAGLGGFAIARQAASSTGTTTASSYTSSSKLQNLPYNSTATRLPSSFPAARASEQDSYNNVKAQELEKAAVAQAREAMAATARAAGADTQGDLVPGSQFCKDQSFVIFDWDDTLLPSYWIAQSGLRLDEEFVIPREKLELLNQVTELALQLLQNASKHGQVCIITNAETGWVELSCRKYLPGLAKELFSGKYWIRSARSEYERPGSPDSTPFGWKCKAFITETTKFFEKRPQSSSRNVISFGDSAHEREALLHTSKMLGSDYTCKTIKFMERPSVTTLQTQQKMMLGSLDRIIQMPTPLDLQIKAPPAPSSN